MTNQDDFERKYDKLWSLLLSLYSVWIDPKSILELTSQSVINVKEIFDSNITVTSNITTPGSAVLITINSFLNLFNSTRCKSPVSVFCEMSVVYLVGSIFKNLTSGLIITKVKKERKKGRLISKGDEVIVVIVSF